MTMMITPLTILIGWFVVSVVPVLAFLPPPTTTTSQQQPRWVSRLGVTEDDHDVTRRDCLLRIPILGILTSTTTILSSFPQSVVGVTNGDDPSSTTTRSASEIARILHPVPTFTIVDADGVPFMVVGEDAKVTGYFFTTYTEAQRILTLARTSVDASIRDERTQQQQQQQQRWNVRPTTTEVSQSTADPVLINPWKSARISTVPLDVAVTLSLKGLNGNTVRNYFQVAAAETDIQTALQLTNQTSLAEGKVPLFYIPDWTLNDQTTTTTPLYFSQDELIRAYQTQNPSSSRRPPAIQVTELFAVLTAMATNDDDMQNTTIVLVPPRSSAQWVRQCNAQNAGKPPFQLGQRNIVL